jgi:hypothetical protein
LKYLNQEAISVHFYQPRWNILMPPRFQSPGIGY